jgi:hypothetical protein
MVKAKRVAPTRRSYEYYHQYGLTTTAKKSAKRAATTKRSAKKR